jgi:ferredoxin
MDAAMAYMAGCEPAQLPFLQKAAQMGLGDFDLANIRLEGRLQRIPDFKLPPMGGAGHAGSQAVREFLHSRTLLRPKADPSLCTACGTCVEQCPTGALSMHEDLPQVSAEACITCFCCQELCPEKAISLQ